MSELGRLRIFKEVAEHRSFAKAAQICGVSRAAISKQISALEADLAVMLLERTTRHVALTPLGEIYLEQIRPLLAGIEEASLMVSQIHKEPSGRLRVTAAKHFGETYIVPNLAGFLQEYRELRLELELAERMPDMVREKIDILVGMSISGSPDSIQKTIAQTRYVLCASPKYLQAMGIPNTPDELSLHRYIAHSMRKPNDEIIFANGKKIHVQPYLRLNDTAAMLKLAKDGLGIVQLHEYMVKKEIKENSLIRLLGSFESAEVPIYLNYQQQRFVLPKIRCFIDFISRILSASHPMGKWIK